MTSTELSQELENFGLDAPEDDVMKILTRLCSKLAIKPSDLADQWMAFSVNNANLDLDMDGAEKFERFAIAKSQQSPIIKKEKKSVLNPATQIGDLFDDILGAYLPESSPVRKSLSQKRPLESPSPFRVPKVSKTPTRHSHSISRITRDVACSLSPVNVSPSQTYSQRKGSGDIVCTYNEGGTEPEWGGTDHLMPVQISPLSCGGDYKFMYQKLSAKSEALDEHLAIMGRMLAAHHEVEFESVVLPQQGAARVVGRVMCDSQGKMNSSSVVLEGSLDVSFGRRVPVDLRPLEKYALFPGQIVGMEGSNPTGRKFVATKLLEPVPLKKVQVSMENKMTVMGACGPYTSMDTLSYEPLSDLIEKVKVESPDVLILLGPFVDRKHPLVEKCDIGDMTFEELYISQIKHVLQNIPESTQLIIVPSSRESSASQVYPQPAPSLPLSAPNLTITPDPAILDVGGLVMGVTSSDVLFHLSSEEVSYPSGSDRMGRLAGHLLHQHNFYPLHPPSDDINIDYPNFIKHGFFEAKPDVLLLPSDLRYFVKNVTDTVVVNPGKLGKGSGTYFKMFVKPSQKLCSSTYVNVVKI